MKHQITSQQKLDILINAQIQALQNYYDYYYYSSTGETF